MDPNCLPLPIEILERIIELVPDDTGADERKIRENKDTILTCALVCKTWMVLARRRLLSLYFPTRKVTIKAEPKDTLSLVDIFGSPFCTLDPAFFKVLDFQRDDSFETRDRTDLFAALAVLDMRNFPSLRTIEFQGDRIRPHEGEDDNTFEYPLQQLLSQIRSLAIRTRDSIPFKDIIFIIQLCPFIERLTVSSVLGDGYDSINPCHHFPDPPTSLRELDLCVQAVPEMTKWMMGHSRNHANISSFTLSSFWWNNDVGCDYLRRFLHGIGPSLKELTLKVYEYDAPFIEFEPCLPLDQFNENTSIKRFRLMTELGVAVKLLPCLFEQPHFAPQLELLEVHILHSASTETYLKKLILLDQYIHSRPLLRQIALYCPWSGPPEDRGDVEVRIIKQCLAQWEEKVRVELRLT